MARFLVYNINNMRDRVLRLERTVAKLERETRRAPFRVLPKPYHPHALHRRVGSNPNHHGTKSYIDFPLRGERKIQQLTGILQKLQHNGNG